MPKQAVFRAISHPARRDMMEMLSSRQMSIGSIAAHFDMTRPAVAKHLAVLRDAGLITVRRAGRETLNQLDPTALKDVEDWLAFYRQFWDQKLDALKAAIEEEND